MNAANRKDSRFSVNLIDVVFHMFLLASPLVDPSIRVNETYFDNACEKEDLVQPNRKCPGLL